MQKNPYFLKLRSEHEIQLKAEEPNARRKTVGKRTLKI